MVVPPTILDLAPKGALGHRLLEARSDLGLSRREVADRLGGAFTETFLRLVETGQLGLGPVELRRLEVFYQLNMAAAMQKRARLIVDAREGEMWVGDECTPLPKGANRRHVTLRNYVESVSRARGVVPSPTMPLREEDVQVLAKAFREIPDAIEYELQQILKRELSTPRPAAPQPKSLRLAFMAGPLVGLAGVAALVATRL